MRKFRYLLKARQHRYIDFIKDGVPTVCTKDSIQLVQGLYHYLVTGQENGYYSDLIFAVPMNKSVDIYHTIYSLDDSEYDDKIINRILNDVLTAQFTKYKEYVKDEYIEQVNEQLRLMAKNKGHFPKIFEKCPRVGGWVLKITIDLSTPELCAKFKKRILEEATALDIVPVKPVLTDWRKVHFDSLFVNMPLEGLRNQIKLCAKRIHYDVMYYKENPADERTLLETLLIRDFGQSDETSALVVEPAFLGVEHLYGEQDIKNDGSIEVYIPFIIPQQTDYAYMRFTAQLCSTGVEYLERAYDIKDYGECKCVYTKYLGDTGWGNDLVMFKANIKFRDISAYNAFMFRLTAGASAYTTAK